MDLMHAYQAVNKILNHINFGDLYPNFKKYKFALYNQNAVCFDGNLMPYDEQFCANTSIEYQGEYIAIWDMDYETDFDAEILASDMIHEMYHCFQYESGESRFPDDLKLLNYPSDLQNYLNKYQENQQLAKAFSGNDKKALKRFFEIRNFRFDKHKEDIKEEFKVETIEGMAEYIGLKALAMINKTKYEQILADYIQKLTNDIPLLFDIRRISYFTGAVFYLTLEKMNRKLNNDFNELTVFEQNILFDGRFFDSLENPEIQAQYQKIKTNKKTKISKHLESSLYIEYSAKICGYDPMNMFRSGNLIFCSHFIFLQSNDDCIKIDGPVIVRLKENSNDMITGYYIAKQ